VSDTFAGIQNGRESWGARHCIPRHTHDRAYAAIVLSGGYEECGNHGRFRAVTGDVLLHDAFDAHLDRFQCSGAQLLNLVVPYSARGFCSGRVGDPDVIARAAERDPVAAGMALREQLRENHCAPVDWPDILARDLAANPDRRLDDWASEHGLAAETVSRGFRKVFGLTPASFRAEVRARRGFALIRGSDEPLAIIAAAAGFADQAHLSRSTRALTGRSPGFWRRSNLFKTERPTGE
jgi:AraC-like DNA-binding protein